MPEEPLTCKCTAILVAAGSSQRMGFDKLAAPLGSASVLERTLKAFLTAESITDIIVVCSAERWEKINSNDFPKPIKRVDGGANRQDSVASGLGAIHAATELIAIHDGARPLISPQDIDRCVTAAIAHQAAALVRRVTETLKRGDADDFSDHAISRDQLWIMETPQVFHAALIHQAYQVVKQQNLVVTDEVSAMEVIGIRVKFIESRHPNIKITTPTDLELARALLR